MTVLENNTKSRPSCDFHHGCTFYNKDDKTCAGSVLQFLYCVKVHSPCCEIYKLYSGGHPVEHDIYPDGEVKINDSDSLFGSKG